MSCTYMFVALSDHMTEIIEIIEIIKIIEIGIIGIIGIIEIMTKADIDEIGRAHV